jgi:hypothetical protein
MSDLTRQGLLQQLNAKSHSGEYLEVLGKKASADWGSGQYKTLTEAVTGTVKQAQLSPEQVKRVVEFANTDAYLKEFKKEGSTHRVVEFDGGPADASEILRDLNDGGGGSVFDRGTGDYSSPPKEMKVASVKAEEELEGLFLKEAGVKTGGVEEGLPYENPHGEVIYLKDKLASAADQLNSQLSGLEIMYADLGDRLYHQVKQAALSGVSLGDVMQAWQTVAPTEEYIKVAFHLITPRLLRDGVFYRVEEMTASVDKTAGVHVVNTEHPLVSEFEEFCTVLYKLAETRQTAREVRGHLSHLTNYLKEASLISDTYAASRGAGKAVRPLAEKAFGPTAGAIAEHGIAQLPTAAAAIGLSEANTHLQHSQNPVARAARGTGNLVMRNIPGTLQNQQHKYEVERG